MKFCHRTSRRALALLLSLTLCVSMIPSVFAAQQNSYHDPADHWLTSNDRTNELDANAVVTHEGFWCDVCQANTDFKVFRTPEYTKDGQTALKRNVRYSDGTMIDGESKGTILDGTPGVDAYYTGYHWTKAVCERCGSINSNGIDYAYDKNIYLLYDCAAEFTEQLSETVTYAYTDSTYHTKTTTGGTYCGFCYGTHRNTQPVLERHSLKTTVTPELGHQRFAVRDDCTLCDYEKVRYVAAKSVISNYYGTVDEQPHTLTVTDLSEGGVSTSIRYGNSADSCTMTSAPSYTEEGQYTVYYAITYTYKDVSMTENGVAYVWLWDEHSPSNPCKNHSFAYLDTVNPGCLTLGYDRYLCTECGQVDKRNYVNAVGHNYQGVVIREATCETDGKLLEICSRCGDTKVTNTPKGEHTYETYSVKPTCVSPGYKVKECAVCGERHITDITNALPHDYKSHVTPATCEAGGSTLHLCDGCGSSFVTDYTEALGHSWDKGKTVTKPTCTGEGVTEYRCTRCDYHRLEGMEATGHTPGDPATCTKNQTCTVCGAVLATATGHKPSDWIVDKKPTTKAEGQRHKECETCGETLETETMDKLYKLATTDTHGKAIVGGYLVIVTDTDTENPVANATVILNEDDTLTIRLPDSRLLDYADQTTVTVQLVKDKSPVEEMAVSVTDKNDNFSGGKTDSAGQLTVPGTSGNTNGDGKGTVGTEDEDGNRTTVTVKVEQEETGEPVPDADVSIDKDGNISVTLPDDTEMDEDHHITVTVTDNEKNPLPDRNVTVTDSAGQSAEGKTDADGKLTVPPAPPTERHGVYIVGYPDGTFGPERSMTRAEAAAIFARLLAEQNGDTITGTANTKFTDVPKDAWYSGYVKYLADYGIVEGHGNNTFAPNDPVTRAEFTAMSVRFFTVYGTGNAEIMTQYTNFRDVSAGYWAAEYIRDAAVHGWVIGYGDGSFRGDAKITRAEVVTMADRLLGRTADMEYVADHLKQLVTFSDLESKHWAYYAVLEAANGHMAEKNDNGESWNIE